jgi:superfamily II DNA/RNA helicase
MTHHVFEVSDQDAKKDLIHALASGRGRRILFMRTKHQARKLARQLTEAGIPSVDLHGNLSQAARDRNLASFSAGEARVLVATDVAARGVHVDDVQLVVHVDPPAEHKAYLHRSGRTARAGSAGDVVTVVLPEQRKDLALLMRKAAIKVTPLRSTADSAHVLDLVGAIAPHVTPAPKAAAPASNGGGRNQRPGGAQGGRGGQDGRAHGQGGGARRSRSGGAGRPRAASSTGGGTRTASAAGSRRRQG